MLIVSNTTPVISLLKLNMLELLEKMYGKVIISEGVYSELIANTSMTDEIIKVNNCNAIKIQKVDNELAVMLLRQQLNLGLGESESIVLANSSKANLLIIDEKKGRRIAKELGLPVTGVLGILVEAKNRGFINKIKPLLDKLIANDIRISPKLYHDILALVNE